MGGVDESKNEDPSLTFGEKPVIRFRQGAKKIIKNDIPTLLYVWFPDSKSSMGCFCVRVQNKVRFKLLPKAKAACLEFG